MKKDLIPFSTPYQLKTITIQITDGILLPVSVIGKGKPVLLMHAFGMDARQFLPFILPLIQHYCFYLPHFRGFGLASHLALSTFDFIKQYAQDTQDVFEYVSEETGIEAFPVAAISMGALVMWAYFQRFGTQRVSRYLNIDQAPIIHNQPDWQGGGVFGARQTELFAEFTRLIADVAPYMQAEQMVDFRHLPYRLKVNLLDMERSFSLLSVSSKSSQLLVKALSYRAPHKISLMQHATWQHKLRCLSAYVALPYDYREVLPTVNIPTTLLIGGRSQLYSAEWQQRLTTLLPNAHSIILPKSGHAVPMDAPVGFYNVLKRFLHS
ncbi:alpha/beta fold hydrolase [Psychrobacter sp. SWN149]|uniref:alpha/beta fold hydrolase n=1 Tax=Psychrobacter sp. SWN149 TaxID=2792057 RepID=UPI0018CEBAB9|nr:alpha/beta hydrolase [Psychrobacter sp. SWN149]MBH0007298.1 alpha/beta hydrolase [Psychrobacter sp. SWN149]